MTGFIQRLLGLFGGGSKTPSGKKILHVGNVANLAYVNAKILNDRGFENHVAAPDLYHFASSPQWQELIGSTVTRDDLGDDWHPNFFSVASAAGLMPDWVAQGPTHLVVTYLYMKATNDPRADLAHDALEYYRMKSAALKTTLPQAARLSELDFREIMESYPLRSGERAMLRRGREADVVFETFRRVIGSLYGDDTANGVAAPFAYQNAVAYAGVDPELNSKWLRLNGTGEAAAFGIVMDDELTRSRISCPPGVREEDFNAYAITLPWWKALFDAYDHVILYGSSAILGLLTGTRYIALEHGNIRDIPFRDDSLGRLSKLAYQRADAVLITNSDYVIAKPRLEFEEDRRYYLPHPMEDELLETYRKRHGKPLSEDGNVRFFSPARQDWQRNDPSLSKGNDRVVRAVANLKMEGIENIRVTFVDWGRDADATRDLIKSLGVEAQFKWTRPLAKGDLWKAYLASHAVIDQFFLDAFGGVTYEALALGRRVITRDDGKANVEFFEGKPPPLLSAATVFEITNRMREVANDPADSRAVGQASREWITEMHSAHRIAEIIGCVFDRVAEIGSPEVKGETVAGPAAVTVPDQELTEPAAAVVTPSPMVERSIAAEESRAAETSSATDSHDHAASEPAKAPARRKPAAKKPAAGSSARRAASTTRKTSARPTAAAGKTSATSTAARKTTPKKPAAGKTGSKTAAAKSTAGSGKASRKPSSAKATATKSAVASKTKAAATKATSSSQPKAAAGKTASSRKPSTTTARQKAQTATATKAASAAKPSARKPAAKTSAAKATPSKSRDGSSGGAGKTSSMVPVSEALKSGTPSKAETGKPATGKPAAKKAAAKKPTASKSPAAKAAPAKKPAVSNKKASGG
jgi:glycosyltransferase involved in cell wall biosynthesis